MQITGHCSADAWEPWTDPLDPGTRRVKKLVILKEVVCDGSKMKLNDMVSEIGQSSLSSSSRCRHHLTHYLKTLITLYNLGSDSALDPINTAQLLTNKWSLSLFLRAMMLMILRIFNTLNVEYFMLNVYRENCIS